MICRRKVTICKQKKTKNPNEKIVEDEIRGRGQRIRVKQRKPVHSCKEKAGWFKAKDQTLSRKNVDEYYLTTRETKIGTRTLQRNNSDAIRRNQELQRQRMEINLPSQVELQKQKKDMIDLDSLKQRSKPTQHHVVFKWMV